MNIIDSIQNLKRIQQDELKVSIGAFRQPVEKAQFTKLEGFINEKLPEEFKALYNYADGQEYENSGLLFGHHFMSVNDILRQLETSKSFKKPKNPSIANPKKSRNLLDQIVKFYLKQAPDHRLLGLLKSWYKMEFQCGLNHYGGPYFYKTEKTTNRDRTNQRISDYSDVAKIIKQLHDLEKETYNWDELKFVVWANGSYEVERTFFNLENDIPFTSTPPNCIKLNYFNHKWIPVFSDQCGNFIGIDMDPDKEGIVGQVINFGSDEENMMVLASSLTEFLNKLLIEIKKPNSLLLNEEIHLHDSLKSIFKN